MEPAQYQKDTSKDQSQERVQRLDEYDFPQWLSDHALVAS